MSPLVSVIIPTFGRQQKLLRAVQSVRDQSGLPNGAVEIIVVDDASPEPIQLDVPEARIVRHPVNRGAAAGRNTGVNAAAGELIAFLDSDDVWLAHKLQRQISLFEELKKTQDPTLLAVGTGFYDPDRRTGALRARRPVSARQLEQFAGGCWFCPGSALLLSRTAFDRVGPQDDSLRRLEDLDWFIRFGAAGGQFVSTPTHDALIHPSGNAPFDAVMIATRQLADKFGPGGKSPLPSRAWNRLAAYLALERAVAHFGNRQPVAGMVELSKTFIRKPRTQPALERFWQEGADVPDEVQRTFDDMVRPSVARVTPGTQSA